MNDWKKLMAARLSAGVAPTYAELEEALAGALAERNAMQTQVDEFADWLKRLATAHILKKPDAVANILDFFVAAHVKTEPLQPDPETRH